MPRQMHSLSCPHLSRRSPYCRCPRHYQDKVRSAARIPGDRLGWLHKGRGQTVITSSRMLPPAALQMLRN